MSEGQQLDASVDLSVNCKYKLNLNNELTFVNLNLLYLNRCLSSFFYNELRNILVSRNPIHTRDFIVIHWA